MLRSVARLSKTAARPMARAMPKVSIPARSMADNPYFNVNILIPCDPTVEHEEIIAVMNPASQKFEPVVVAVTEPSFEFLFSSPVDLHLFDVIPVVKDCIDPTTAAAPVLDA